MRNPIHLDKEIGRIAVTATVCATLGVGIGAQMVKPVPLTNTAIAAPAPAPVAGPLQINSENFRAVARKVGPSVLTIKAAHEARPQSRSFTQRGPQRGGSMEDFLNQFGFGFELPPARSSEQASGSGFLIDKLGHIVTNYHVIKGASKITVLTPDDDAEEREAKVVGADPRTDLAVLQISNVEDLIPIEWADSNDIEVGDYAIAIGSPFMLTHSVTAGIVSAKGRNASALMGAGFGYELIQTDTAINPGNSGGPLCTAAGKVMGVNTAIYTQSGGYMGIGFAIPSNVAQNITAKLIKEGKITRGWLGVAIQKADKDLLKDLGVASAVVVHEVQQNSPADSAGLHAGDAIVEVAGKKVAKTEEVQSLIAGMHPGEKISLKILNYQDKKDRIVEVRVGQLPEPTT